MFSQFGKILDVVALKTLRMRGQAWVVFADVAAATNAKNTMQGFPFFEKPIVSSSGPTAADVWHSSRGLLYGSSMASCTCVIAAIGSWQRAGQHCSASCSSGSWISSSCGSSLHSAWFAAAIVCTGTTPSACAGNCPECHQGDSAGRYLHILCCPGALLVSSCCQLTGEPASTANYAPVDCCQLNLLFSASVLPCRCGLLLRPAAHPVCPHQE
jgi:hypothetical protein